MPMISMDGTENELVMVAIKMRLNTFFYLSHLIFCNSNSAASSTMHGETYGGGLVVPSLMVPENGAIGFVCMFFSDSGNIAAASKTNVFPARSCASRSNVLPPSREVTPWLTLVMPGKALCNCAFRLAVERKTVTNERG